LHTDTDSGSRFDPLETFSNFGVFTGIGSGCTCFA
jgi:hypothetical protein